MSGQQTPLPGFDRSAKIKGGSNAYPAMPGTGPDGETCKTCNHSFYHGRSKRYWKCGLVKSTSGPATDIRVSSPACNRWVPKE